MDEQEIEHPKRRRRTLRPLLAALAILLVIGLATLWLLRERLAENYIESELAARGVRATYRIERIGFGNQILENLVIGDPARPDATARRVEVQILLGLTGPRIGLITARGVRLNGRIVNGRLTLGEVDRLLPPPSGRPFSLPDQAIDVDDAAILLATPAGPVALGLAGRGNLADGFRGALAVETRRLRLGGCDLDGARARFAVRVDDLRPHLEGPAAMRSLACAGLRVEQPLLALDATFAPALDSWRGTGALRAASLGAGDAALANLEGRIAFSGDARETRGRTSFATTDPRSGDYRASRLAFTGDYAASFQRNALAVDGELAAQGVTAGGEALRPLLAALRGAAATPLGPIAASLAGAVARAGRSGARIGVRVRLAEGTLTLSGLRAESASGARLLGDGGAGIVYGLSDGALRLDGDFALSGGGFPDARLVLRQPRPGGPMSGEARIAPLSAGGVRLALAPIRFTAAPGGATSFRTVAALDGPFNGGRVQGLVLPLSGRFGGGGFALGEGCVAATFAALQVQGLRLGPSRLPLCPAGRALVWSDGGGLRGGAELRAPRLAGRLGGSPIALAANRVRVDLAGFQAAALAVRLRGGAGDSRLDIARLDGRFSGGGVGGAFAGLAGDLANVPLLASEGAGRWRFARGRLEAGGRLQVADRLEPDRFAPLMSEDFRLTLVDNRIRAGGALAHPASGTRIAEVAIDHDLGRGAGNATLDVPGIRFAGDFQPATLSRLALGVVALVDGTLSGRGRIDWDANGVRSTGTFSTENANLAAPFGPVEGLSTTIQFTDLLGLASAPRQEARVRLIRAGVDVYDGVIRYELQPGYRVAIEDGRWPFAGGTLDIAPTVLDFSRETTKYITFRVTALDAARFIETLDFSNIAATGTFDGTVPMQFDQSGGRIVGGLLVARPEGGTLSYVGELSDRDLGAYGILAFNALKSLRYSRFDLTLDGALDGEFITRINLDGVARDPVLTTLPGGGGITQAVASRVFSQVARIPFEFNIRIQGQFRSLMATARSFNDPTPLIQSALPGLLDQQSQPAPIQPQESEPVQ